jgi:hypothetical protein
LSDDRIPNLRLVNHRVPGMHGFLKGSYPRSPLDIAISFGAEQTLDEVHQRHHGARISDHPERPRKPPYASRMVSEPARDRIDRLGGPRPR